MSTLTLASSFGSRDRTNLEPIADMLSLNMAAIVDRVRLEPIGGG